MSACGGGGSTPAPQAASSSEQPVPASKKSTVKIALYGDSTMWGTTYKNGTYSQSPNNPTAALQTLLQAKYGPGVTVENHALPGSTAPENLWGQPPASINWATAMAQSSADIVVINLGINDAYAPDEELADFTYCLGQFVQIARQYGKTVVLQTSNPINTDHEAILGQLVAAEKALAAPLSVPLIDDWSVVQANIPNWQAHTPDNVHPDDGLYQYEATVAIATLAPLVAQMLQ
jgi:lysophospholipase L1-like esterase